MDVEPNPHKETPPASAKVSIYEVTMRPWGELQTDARRDDRAYVGTKQWREKRLAAGDRRRGASA